VKWDEEKIEQLRLLVELRRSGGSIAAEMGTTRNAIVGKCFRLGLKLCSIPQRRPRVAGAKPERLRIRLLTFTSRKSALPKPASFRCVSILAVDHNQCRYPVKDGPPMALCGLDREEPDNSANAYCAFHADLAYQCHRAPMQQAA
jgi:GcrA cell cycle regulator